MTHQPRPAKPRGCPPASKMGSPTPQLVQMELKQRILFALGRLADRDTQQIAVEELDKLVETISPDCVSIFLSCLYDTELQQKSVVKKECVRLFSSLASRHIDLLIPHLTKIISSIMRRLRDPDSSVRDACVDSIGALSALMLCPPSSSSTGLEKENGAQNASSLTLATFSKPLFDALSEQNKSVQTGAALCLARAIESAKSPPLSALARLCPRICKFMSNPNFLARPALLAVIGSLSQVGALGQQQLAILMPCIHEALENSDWATRKAAAETLSHVGSNLGPALSSFKVTTLEVLESCRFDKVKPVRDRINDAVQTWKGLPGMDSDSTISAKKSDSTDVAKVELPSTYTLSTALTSNAKSGPANGTETETSLQEGPLALSEKPFEAFKKRVPALTDKKLNPEFFQKLAMKDDDDWQIEVAVPRSCPPSLKAQEPEQSIEDGQPDVDDLSTSSPRRGQLDLSRERLVQDPGVLPNGRVRGLLFRQVADENPPTRSRGLRRIPTSQKVLDRNLPNSVPYTQAWAENNGHGTSPSSNGALVANQVAADERLNWQVIHKQLFQLEQQQASLLQMIQDIMVSSQQTTSVLQARIHELENVVEGLACDVGFPSVNSLRVGAMGLETNGPRLPRYVPRSDYPNPRLNRTMDGFRLLADRVYGSDSTSRPIRHIGQSFHDRPLIDTDNTDSDQLGVRRLWDRLPGAVSRRGEGPSARSVWQASKDEATLAAIRGAGEEDSELSEMDAPSTALAPPPLLPPKGSGSTSPRHKFSATSEGQSRGHYWSLWASVMELIRAGDMEAAYAEVVSAEDELMLVRLMARTGPVLDQFSTATATEVLCVISLLLQEQTYLELCLAWIEQVADMVASNGVECMGISMDSKKELLLALQEAASMHKPEGWLGTDADELMQQLAHAWSIDMMAAETDS